MKKKAAFYLLATALMLVLLGVECASAQTAAPINDPLKKPAVWALLRGAPADSMLWARYIGKPWAVLTKKESDDLYHWRESLLEVIGEIVVRQKNDRVDWSERPKPETNANGQVKLDDVAEEKIKVDKEVADYIKHLEQTMVQESVTLKSLKANAMTNFVIIEEAYEEEFKKLGVEYIPYAKLYPKGGYSKQQWLEDKERQLKELKSKKFEETKQAILRAHGKG
jgi:hypothetical protein